MRSPIFISLLLALLMLNACDEDGVPSGPKANLTLEISNISFDVKDGRQVFNHTRTFIEKNGVDLKITRGKICVESKNTCVDAFLEYEVDGDGKLVQPNHHVATRQGQDIITFEYWATDENGYEHQISQTMEVNEQTATVLK